MFSQTTLPIELLWRLNVEGVMKYDAYITWYGHG